MSSAGSYGGSGGGGVGSVLFLTGNSGGPVAPDLTGNINVVGTGAITVVDNPGTHTLTIELSGSVATVYDANTGSAIPVAGVLNINGLAGIVTSASGNTIDISTDGTIAIIYETDSGAASPAADTINIVGGTGITTSGSGSTITITSTSSGVTSIQGDTGGPISGALTITGGGTGLLFDTSGSPDIILEADFLALPDTNNILTTGYIAIGGTPVLAMCGGVANSNVCVGPVAGTAGMTGIQNICIGAGSLSHGSNSVSNTVSIGTNSCQNLATGSENVSIGTDALNVATSSTGNVAIGYGAATGLLTGTDNIVIGVSAGGNYTGAESGNIIIGANGITSESDALHIGSALTAAYISGIFSESVGGTNALVYCDNTGKLGTTGGTFPSLGTTNHAVQVGNSSGGLHSIAVGTTGQVLIGSTGADPAFGALGVNSGLTTHGVLLGENNSAIVATAAGANGQVLVGSTGADPVFATLGSNGSLSYTTGTGSLSISITAPVSIANGGTNATSMTNTDGVVYYDGTRLVTTAVGSATQVLTSNGAGVAPTFQPAAGGGVSSLAGDSGGALTGALTLTGGSSGAVFTGAGTTLTTTFTKLAMSDTTSTTGYIQIGTQKVLACWGGVSNNNIFVGQGAGHVTVSGTDNDGFGDQALAAVTTGSFNVGIGSSALQALTTSSENVAIGLNALSALTTGGGGNTVVGFAAGGSFNTGANNLILGSTAGGGYTGSESNNIVIGAQGVAAEGHAIHIGDDTTYGAFTKCFIGGIAGVTVASSAAVLINTSTGQLGTVPSSRRFKENIDDMGAASRDIYKLRPVKFNFKGDFNESYGLIAEDVEEIMPHLVSYDKEGLPATVKYHELPALLLNEIQRLKLKVEELEGKFNARIR